MLQFINHQNMQIPIRLYETQNTLFLNVIIYVLNESVLMFYLINNKFYYYISITRYLSATVSLSDNHNG